MERFILILVFMRLLLQTMMILLVRMWWLKRNNPDLRNLYQPIFTSVKTIVRGLKSSTLNGLQMKSWGMWVQNGHIWIENWKNLITKWQLKIRLDMTNSLWSMLKWIRTNPKAQISDGRRFPLSNRNIKSSSKDLMTPMIHIWIKNLNQKILI